MFTEAERRLSERIYWRQREARPLCRHNSEPSYSIVIPAYNESARLGATLEKVLAYVRAQKWDAEVIVINDGSRDSTADIVRTFAGKDPALRLVENPGNRGKGYSVRNGMLNARGLFSDADLSAPTFDIIVDTPACCGVTG
jgi:glycosyltransferase involved in cell wall biosynthesis